MDLKHYSNQQLHERLLGLVQDERTMLLKILHHLRETEQRRDYIERGFSSLYQYVHKGLGYSEAASYRRIEAMRLLRDLPEVEEKIHEGKFSLSTIAQTQKFFRDESVKSRSKKLEILKSVEGMGARESEKILLSQATTPVGQQTLRPEKVTQLTPEVVRLELIITTELWEQIQALQRKTSHQNSSIIETLAYGVKLGLKTPTHCFSDKRSENARYVTPGLRTEVLKRGQCEYVDSKTGRRCDSRSFLQVDHIVPIALGGDSRPENLRVLCSAHNQFLGEGLKMIV